MSKNDVKNLKKNFLIFFLIFDFHLMLSVVLLVPFMETR